MATSKIMTRYEETTKGLMEAVRIARIASEHVQSLAEKERFVTLRRGLEQALCIVRLQYHEYEDATRITDQQGGFCPICGERITLTSVRPRTAD